ncbi:unnamed protein product [Parnassius mnemosyne]|uniref:Uncharacterized protein n=1 Tax=Parnassius mnemosyne TaxID=213953 RepID=A0AAV1KAJ2_9NEOP
MSNNNFFMLEIIQKKLNSQPGKHLHLSSFVNQNADALSLVRTKMECLFISKKGLRFSTLTIRNTVALSCYFKLVFCENVVLPRSSRPIRATTILLQVIMDCSYHHLRLLPTTLIKLR